MSFPEDFTWGVASSAYQIEGATAEDGRGPSVWDAFCRRAGAIRFGHDADVACDHYHRWPEDIELMSRLGARAYRFSIAWPRVMPTGRAPISERGLDFYDALVDALLARGIAPWVTLFHWDYPLELYWRGGWLNPDSPGWFADYAAAVVARLSDRVTSWITLNEPQVFIGLGHYRGVHAPGLQYSRADILRATHHSLLAHGLSVQVIRAGARRPPRVGWSPVGWVSYPVDDSLEAVQAARRLMFSIADDVALWPMNNVWYSDPVVLGSYPEEGLRKFGADVPPGATDPAQLATIAQPLDFYGVNIYHGRPVAYPLAVDDRGDVTLGDRTPGHPETLMGWFVDPGALYWGPRFLAERYQLPIYITENGIAAMDWVHADGRVNDQARIDYLRRHLYELSRAVAEGVDIRGYFQWSLTDNFEWELGYSKRFGLVYVDYRTLERIPKESFAWYGRVIASRGGNLDRDHAPLR